MMQYKVDINCDVGEGVGNEADIFPYISSCNIACGGHAGDTETMYRVVSLAKQHRLKVGAHPSYPDKTNFGREVMDISNKDLVQSIQKQLSDFDAVLQQEEVTLHHIKAHGALYNQTAKDKELAKQRFYLFLLIRKSQKWLKRRGLRFGLRPLRTEITIQIYPSFPEKNPMH
mgnify:CR=1 FL=1